MKKYDVRDYTFWGLFSHGEELDVPLTTLAYVVALVDRSQNDILDLKKAKFVLSMLYDVEEQVRSARGLISRQESIFPKGYCAQTPVMLTLRWSPIAAMLERGWTPIVLSREATGMACASGIWQVKTLEHAPPPEQCETPEELFWCVLEKIILKAKNRGLLLSIIAQPGWSYEFGELCNLTRAEAEQADRVIWQRTPKQTKQLRGQSYHG